MTGAKQQVRSEWNEGVEVVDEQHPDPKPTTTGEDWNIRRTGSAPTSTLLLMPTSFERRPLQVQTVFEGVNTASRHCRPAAVLWAASRGGLNFKVDLRDFVDDLSSGLPLRLAGFV